MAMTVNMGPGNQANTPSLAVKSRSLPLRFKSKTRSAAIPTVLRYRIHEQGRQMPLQNRVTPFGEIVAVSDRGLFTGNRGFVNSY